MAGLTQGDRVPDFDVLWMCQPSLFRLDRPDDASQWRKFCSDYPDVDCIESLHSQLCELMGILDPRAKLTDAQRVERAEAYLAERGGMAGYGTWVFFPWLSKAVHILEEEDFIRVRTNRNMYKITSKEQVLFGSKKIGVIGMSVGKAIARVLTTERVCGEIRIADFDQLDLSNLNRIQSSVVNLGMPKTTIVAREIAEQDPYVKVVVYPKGITTDNIDDFLTKDGKLDILVDECDGIDIKIKCRLAARKHRIPVLMETNDRGMLDVERFDLEPNRPLFHGLIDEGEVPLIQDLDSAGEKAPFVARILGVEELSLEMRCSMLAIDSSIESWPQLNSDVLTGASVVAGEVKRIFTNKSMRSFRVRKQTPFTKDALKALDVGSGKEAKVAFFEVVSDDANPIWKELINQGVWAPSGGNAQPWTFRANGDVLEIHRKVDYQNSLDHNSRGSIIALEALAQIIETEIFELGLCCSVERNSRFPIESEFVRFAIERLGCEIGNLIGPKWRYRKTDRGAGELSGQGSNIDQEIISDIVLALGQSRTVFALPSAGDHLRNELAVLEKHRLVDKRWRKELMEELTFCKNDIVGISVDKLGLRPEEVLGVRLLAEPETMERHVEVTTGPREHLEDMFRRFWDSCFGFVLISCPDGNESQSAQVLNALWSKICAIGYGVQPLSAGIFVGNGIGRINGVNSAWKELAGELAEPFFILGIRQSSIRNERSGRHLISQNNRSQ